MEQKFPEITTILQTMATAAIQRVVPLLLALPVTEAELTMENT